MLETYRGVRAHEDNLVGVTQVLEAHGGERLTNVDERWTSAGVETPAAFRIGVPTLPRSWPADSEKEAGIANDTRSGALSTSQACYRSDNPFQ